MTSSASSGHERIFKDELALFGPEEARERVTRPAEAWGAEAPTWHRYATTKTRGPVCTHCIDEARDKGIAPQPLRAVWRRKGPNGDVHLCLGHAQLQRELDARAAALAKARKDITERAPATRRRREGSS